MFLVPNQKFYKARRIFNRNLDFEDELDSKYYTVRYTHKDPSFAKDISDIIVFELNQRKKEQDIKEAQAATIFLTDRIQTVTNSEVRGSISRLIEMQLKREMIANMRQEYLATVIDQPAQPLRKSGPLRGLIFVVSFLVSTFLLVPVYAFRYIRE